MTPDPHLPRSRPPAPHSQPAPAASPAPADTEDSWTIGRLLTWTADYLKRRGAESPRLDTEVLLAHVLGWERVRLYTHYEEVVGDQPRVAEHLEVFGDGRATEL